MADEIKPFVLKMDSMTRSKSHARQATYNSMKDSFEKSGDNGTPSSFNPVVKNVLNTVNHEKEPEPIGRPFDIVQ